MRNSIVALLIVVALLVGSGATYFARNSSSSTTTTVISTTTSFGSVFLQPTTITTVARTTLPFGGSTYSITTGEYSGCIPPVQCYLTTITTWTSIVSSSEVTQVIGLTLERAPVNQTIPDYTLIKDKQNIILSNENLNGIQDPQIDGITLVPLSPQQIQDRADASGDFPYLRFSQITVGDSTITISIENVWAVGVSSHTGYLSGGGYTIVYQKTPDGWMGNLTQTWIS